MTTAADRLAKIESVMARWRGSALRCEAEAARLRQRFADKVKRVEVVTIRFGAVASERGHVTVGGSFALWDKYIVRAVAQERSAALAWARHARHWRMWRRYKNNAGLAAATKLIAARTILDGSVARAKEAKRKPEAERIEKLKDKINERLVEGRSLPISAITLQPVVFESPKQRQQKARRLKTASKFKGTRFIGEMLAAAEAATTDLDGRVPVTVDRAEAWRIDAELERNRRAVPKVWDAMAVDLWLQGAYETLFRLPIKTRPAQFGSCMPTPADHRDSDWADEVARAGNIDGEEIQPLFGLARLKALGMPEKFEVDRMNVALHWPTQFLLDHPRVARIVGVAAMWKALDISFTGDGFRKLCNKRFGMWPVEFDRMRGAGLVIIAGGLNAVATRAAIATG